MRTVIRELYQAKGIFKMFLTMLKSKLHSVTVTETVLEYEGSLTIDSDLMAEVKMLPYEKILIANMENGNRFETYAIPGAAGSGVIGLNGATARLGKVGDRLIVFSFCQVPQETARSHKPLVLVVGEGNKPVGGLRQL